jgi:DNA-binding SARP family transcriptional activator
MDFRLLGPLEVSEGDRPIAVGAGKQRALLAVLLLHPNEVVSTERLVDELWGASPPATVGKSVQTYVSRLRKVLGDGRLGTRPPGYVLRVEPAELDAARFERLVAEASGAAPREAARALHEALALWRGPALGDLAYEPFAQGEVARLEELRLAAIEQRIDAELATGRHAELAGELEALVRAHPSRERLVAQLMLCLYRCGRQGDALDAYRSARAALVEELGLEPGRPLRELHQGILRQDRALDLVPPREPVPHGAFVGREHELGELRAGLDEAIGGRGRLFLLVGEPGIGKSRLADELAAHAGARGARVAVGRCWEAGGAPAYWPWVQPLRAYARSADPSALRAQLGAGAAVIAQIVPELRERLGGVERPPALEPEAARFRLFDAVAEFLRRASAEQPIVLVLDDLHAADAPSLLLLEFVARELGTMRVLVIGACRDVDPLPAKPLARTLAEVSRAPGTRRLDLRGLGEPAVAEYVRLTAAGIDSPSLVSALHADSGGNPLFVTEMVRLLAVEPAAAVHGAPAVPDSVRDVIARRLGHLPDRCSRVLRLASVLGREFAVDVLARLAELPEDDLRGRLDEARAARAVAEVPGAAGRLRFTHVLVRDALYDALPAARRTELHRRVVEVLEQRYGDASGPHLAELAHHAVAGRDAERGLVYARRAGDRALALLAYEEAARLYRSAIAALDPGDAGGARAHCELLLAVGDAESCAGNTVAAREALLEAAALARRLGLYDVLARAAAEYGGRIVYSRAADDDRVLPLLEEALAALPEDAVALRASLLARLAGALRDEPGRGRRDAVSREAVELARAGGDPAVLAYALDGRALAILAPDTLEEVLAIADELLGVAERSGDRERVVHGHMHGVAAELTAGRVERAHARIRAAARVADELRQPAHQWDVAAARSMLAVAELDVAAAERLVERAFELGRSAQPEIVVPVHRAQRYALCDFRGSHAEIEPEISALVDERPNRPVFRCMLAHLQARLGRLDDAGRAVAELAAGDVGALPFDQEWLLGMSLLAETAALVGDEASAATIYDRLAPWGGLNIVDVCEGIRGAAGRYLGLLAVTTGRLDRAERHFEDALAMNARMGAGPWLALTEHDYARMLRRRASGGDHARSLALEEAALRSFRALGMDGYASAIRRAGPRRGGEPSGGPPMVM